MAKNQIHKYVFYVQKLFPDVMKERLFFFYSEDAVVVLVGGVVLNVVDSSESGSGAGVFLSAGWATPFSTFSRRLVHSFINSFSDEISKSTIFFEEQ